MDAEVLGYVYTAICDSTEDHTGKEGLCVSINSADNFGVPIVRIAAAGAKVHGVILRGEAGTRAERVGKDGTIMCKAADAIAAGQEVASSADGRIIAGTTNPVGMALGTCVANELIPVFVY